MSTWWVDSVSGSDAQDGTTFALAKKTITAGLGLLNVGDTLNLTDTGTHDWPTTETALASLAGTDFTTFGALIRGSDSNGTGALTTIAPLDSDGDVPRRMIGLQSTANFIIMENLRFDATGRNTDTSVYTVCRARVSNSAGPIKFRYGGILGAATGAACAGNRNLIRMDSTSPNDSVRVEYWYFQNTKEPMGPSGWFGATLKATMDHCVGIWDNDDRGFAWFNPGATGAQTGHDANFTNNTLYESAGTTNTAPIITWITTSDGIDIGICNVHSNLVWVTTSGTVESFMNGSAFPTVVFAGTVDSNVLLGGPNVSVGSLISPAEWYQIPWDANNDDSTAPDEQPLDTLSFAEPGADVFNDHNNTYDWMFPNSVSITIMKDLRLIRFTTNGLFGSMPGALPAVGSGEDGGTDMGGGDPDDPATIPFLNVIPFYANVLQYSLNSRLSTEQNRVRLNYMRSDKELKGFREWATRRIQVDTSTTDQIITGIETAELVFLESDEQIQLNAGKVADVFLPDAKIVLLAGGEYSVIKVKNASATNNALTLITVVD